jgi:hypothetical protein
MTVANQNYVCNRIESKLDSGNACYHSVQNPLSSSLLHTNVKLKVYRTVLCFCDVFHILQAFLTNFGSMDFNECNVAYRPVAR